jgi:zinc transport system permease protein
MHEVRIDLMAYLFGDLLAISPTDLAWILGGSALVLVLLVMLWRPCWPSPCMRSWPWSRGCPWRACAWR